MNQAHAGVGSTAPYTTCVLLKAQIGVQKINAVAYRGTGPALNDLVGGQVDFMCDQVTNLTPQIRAGNIKAFANRHAPAPARSARPADHHRSRPARVPDQRLERDLRPEGPAAPIQARLVEALDLALKDDNTRNRLAELGTVIPDATQRTPAGLAAILPGAGPQLLDKPLRESAPSASKAVDLPDQGRGRFFRPRLFHARLGALRGARVASARRRVPASAWRSERCDMSRP